jgi:hypothetical protein
MSIIPQAFRLTTGDGKIPVIPADFFPAPGEYAVAEKTSLTHALTAPHFPRLRAAAARPFGSTADQRGGGGGDRGRDAHNGQHNGDSAGSPVQQRSVPGPGTYEVGAPLGSDLPGATRDYHDEYGKVLGALAHGRVKLAADFPSVVALAETRGSDTFTRQGGMSPVGKFGGVPTPADFQSAGGSGGSGGGGGAGSPKRASKPRDEMANRFRKPAPDPYMWMLGPGSYDDKTQDFGAHEKSKPGGSDDSAAAAAEANKNKWGTTRGIAETEANAMSAAPRIVSPDRMPSERLIVGYKSTDTGKDFNKIYRDVSTSMEALRIARRSEQGTKGWKKELAKMKAKRRRHVTAKLSRFKAPSQFGFAVRIDMDEGKKNLGVLEPGPGSYEARSSFPEDTESAMKGELVRAKRKMQAAEGVDLDNNGIDDGLEIEALLPPAHKNKNTSSFLGADRDSAKFMARYGKGGTPAENPGPMSYEPDMGKSPSMNAKPSSNVLAYRPRSFKYQGKKILSKSAKYDARGKTLFHIKSRATRKKGKGKERNMTASSGSPLRLQDQEWFQSGAAPVLREDVFAHHTMQSHHSDSGVVSAAMAKTIESLERLKIDTVKLGKSFFGGSPTGRKYLLTGSVHEEQAKAKIDFSGLATEGCVDTGANT